MHESESEVAQLCPTPSDPMDCSLPGSSIHGIFQARVLEWGAIRLAEIIVQKALPERVALQVTQLDASLTSLPSYSHACLQTHFHSICRAQIDSSTTAPNTSIILAL